jgi:hypothetical protein
MCLFCTIRHEIIEWPQAGMEDRAGSGILDSLDKWEICLNAA